MRQTAVYVVSTASAGVNHDTGDDLHESCENERALCCRERRPANNPEHTPFILPLPGIDVAGLMQRIVGTPRGVGTKERALRTS